MYLLDKDAHILMAIAGLCGFASIVILNYAISIGLAGVSISLFNINSVIHILLASYFLKQIITYWQIAGVGIAFVGACILSVSG